MNVAFFVFGHSNCGKTYMMKGDASSNGIIKYLSQQLFINDDHKKHNVCVSEVYGGGFVKDLLQNEFIETNGEFKEFNSADDLYTSLNGACEIRSTKSTKLNSQSSRTHMIIQVKKENGKILSIVELAGEEKLSENEEDKDVIIESDFILTSLEEIENSFKSTTVEFQTPIIPATVKNSLDGLICLIGLIDLMKPSESIQTLNKMSRIYNTVKK